MPAFVTSSQHIMAVHYRASMQEKEIKGTQIEKEEMKVISIHR
jgi:hypothetical protein